MDHFGRLLKQANNNMMRHFDQFARQYDLTGNQMAIIDFITNHANHEVFQRDIEHEFEIQRSTTTHRLLNTLLVKEKTTLSTLSLNLSVASLSLLKKVENTKILSKTSTKLLRK